MSLVVSVLPVPAKGSHHWNEKILNLISITTNLVLQDLLRMTSLRNKQRSADGKLMRVSDLPKAWAMEI